MNRNIGRVQSEDAPNHAGSQGSSPGECHLGGKNTSPGEKQEVVVEDASGQIRSVAQSCPIPCDPMNRSTPGLPVHHQLLEFTQTHVHRVRDAICCPLLLLPPIPPRIRVFANESTLRMRWPKYWSFSFFFFLILFYF